MLAPAPVRAHLPAHWLCIPQGGFPNPALPQEDARVPPRVGQIHETHATFLWDDRAGPPRPLAAPWKAGRTAFFRRDFCPCSCPRKALGRPPTAGLSQDQEPQAGGAPWIHPPSVGALGPPSWSLSDLRPNAPAMGGFSAQPT